MSEPRQLRPGLVAAVLATVVALAIGGVVGAWAYEKKRDIVSDVPGLGKFVIRDPADLIQSKLLLGKPWEPDTIPIFRKYIQPGTSVADIGAYNGVHTVRFAGLVGPTGHVYAFEPNPASFDMLKANLALNKLEGRVVAYPYGLAEKATDLKLLTLDTNNQGGTVACSEDDVREHRRYCHLQSATRTTMIRVDDDIERWFPTRVGFVKIDVEGYEDHVLAGSKAWLARDKPIIWIEIWTDEMRKRFNMSVTAANTVSLIRSLGYRLEGILPPLNYLFVPGTEEEGSAPLPGKAPPDGGD